MRSSSIVILVCVFLLMLLALAVYAYLYYPKQVMPIGAPLSVATPDTDKYHNDCLHPCIRYDATSGKYYMAQSPYYGRDSRIENPMFYSSDLYQDWCDGVVITDTPEHGYNSDPNICLCENGELMFLWRECFTPLCDSLGCAYITVGGKPVDGKITDKRVLCACSSPDYDTEQAPVMIEHDGIRYIYATWYQYEPERKNKGIAIWRENANNAKGSICEYQFIDTLPFDSCYTVGKFAQAKLFGRLYFLPKPRYYDLWHFDLFEYDKKLWMVSVNSEGDNVMLSVADDWVHFKTYRKPLVNNHYTENYCGYRQYYYKPTAFVKDDILHVFYSANAKEDPKSNQLFHTALPVRKVLQ